MQEKEEVIVNTFRPRVLWFKHGCARLKLAATHVVVCGLVWPPVVTRCSVITLELKTG